MIRLIYLFIFLFPLFTVGQSASKKSKQLLLSIAKKETKDANYILNSVGDFKFQKYLNHRDTAGVLDMFGTIVHESCHELNYLIGSSQKNPDFKDYSGYYIEQGIEIKLLHEPVFNATELNKFVPDSLHHKIFRYGTYVGDPKKILWNSSQVDGIYGMLDEFSAYYHGTKAQLDLYHFYYQYRCNGFKNTNEWENYLVNISKNIFSYYEFQLFISWYLQYAQLHYPEMYQELINHTELRLVYTLLENEFSQLIDEYYVIQKQLISDLNTPERKVSITQSDGKTWIKVEEKGSMSRQSIQDYEANHLIKLLEGEEHKILEEFKIEGATLENYKSYLK